MSRLRLSLACWNYDRTRALADGRVKPDGIDLNYLDLVVEETFFRTLRYREFDVAELSLSSYSVSRRKHKWTYRTPCHSAHQFLAVQAGHRRDEEQRDACSPLSARA